MRNRDGHRTGGQDDAEAPREKKTRPTFLEGEHGRHGGSEESEGAPQGSPRPDQPADGHGSHQ